MSLNYNILKRNTIIFSEARRSAGFTIVEMLIVVVVIAILAAITIVSYNGIQTRAKASAAQSAVSQAYKLITSHSFSNGGFYPEAAGNNGVDNLSAIGITTTGSPSYQYSANNTSNPSTFCITATFENISYYQNSAASQVAPAAGACPGHGVNGIAAITNFAPNPGCESITLGVTPYNGAAVSRQVSGSAASGGYVCRVMRGTAGSGLMANIYPVPYQQNTSASVRFKARLAPGSAANIGVNVSLSAYNGGMGVAGMTGCTVQAPLTLSTSSWSDITIEGCTTPNVTMSRIGVLITPRQVWQTTDGFEIDSIMIVQRSTAPAFADGTSPGWIWNGTAHESTSTGPLL